MVGRPMSSSAPWSHESLNHKYKQKIINLNCNQHFITLGLTHCCMAFQTSPESEVVTSWWFPVHLDQSVQEAQFFSFILNGPWTVHTLQISNFEYPKLSICCTFIFVLKNLYVTNENCEQSNGRGITVMVIYVVNKHLRWQTVYWTAEI